MNERGWGWTPSEIRRSHLAEWIAQQPADRSVEAFYNGLPDQAVNTYDAARSDLAYLEERGLIELSVAMGGIRGLHVEAAQGVRDLAEELKALRANKRMRKAACRDAMVDWLHSLDATNEMEMPVRDTMAEDPRHGIWFGEPFSGEDLDAAAAWLYRQGMVKGITVDQQAGPVRLYLTDAGVTCAEDYESDTARYLEAQQGAQGSGVSVSFGSNSGPVQVGGHHAQQVQSIGASADELRKVISSVAELVRSLVPDASGIAEQEQAALAAAAPGKVSISILKGFADWAVSVVRSGASAALVPAVSAAVTEMLNLAARLTGH